jgi:hypothetical protein
MKDFQIKGTINSPTFDFNFEKGELEIKGRSYPENAFDIYEPALLWLEEYAKNSKPLTTLNFSLEYFNTSSSKIILEIMRKIKTLQTNGNTIIIRWHYEEIDSRLREEGEIFAELIRFPIEFVELKEYV